jgi:hypothetical protein
LPTQIRFYLHLLPPAIKPIRRRLLPVTTTRRLITRRVLHQLPLFLLLATVAATPPDPAPEPPGANEDITNLWHHDADTSTAAAKRLVQLPNDRRPDAALLDYLRRGRNVAARQQILLGPHGSGLLWTLPTAQLEPVLLDLASDADLRRLARTQLIVKYANDRDADRSPLVRHLVDSLETASSPLEQYDDLYALCSVLGTLAPQYADRSPLREDVARAAGPLLPGLSKSPDFNVRYYVAFLLRELPPAAGLDPALQMIRSEATPDVTDKLLNTLYVHASQPLDPRQRDAVRDAALRVARDDKVKSYIRIDAIELLVRLNDGRLVGDLVGLLHPEGEGDEDIGTVSHGEPRVRSPDTMAIHALARLTGRPPGFDPTAPRPARAAAARRWLRWWTGGAAPREGEREDAK